MSYTICKLQNISGEIKQLHLKEFQIDEVYLIPDSERESWAMNDDVILSITDENFKVLNDFNSSMTIANQILFLQSYTDKNINVISQNPFAAKINNEGKKYYRRVHGVTGQLVANGNTEVSFNIPYTNCLITDCEIVNAPIGLKADFEIYYQTTKLNQFGFDANIAEKYHVDKSPYDAALTSALTIKVTLKNSSDSTNVVGLNFILHEVKD